MTDKISLHLGPMAGVTDAPFRLLCFEQGADICYTEMISAQGLLCAPKDSLAYRQLQYKLVGEGRLYAQIFGREPGYMAEAAAKLYETGRFDGVDINMGCPAPKVTGGGNGSALMKKPDLASRITEAVSRAVPCPVTVKIRLGWDKETASYLAPMLESAGAAALTVHGRTRIQQYAGKADWDAIARAKNSVSIPIIANGDVFSGEDAKSIIARTGCDGVMMARGVLGAPWLFREARAALNGDTYAPPRPKETMLAAVRHGRMMAEWKGEERAVIEMRKHFAWYLKGMPGAARLRREINTMERLKQVEDALCAFGDSFSE